jgi:hypothetical protein
MASIYPFRWVSTILTNTKKERGTLVSSYGLLEDLRLVSSLHFFVCRFNACKILFSSFHAPSRQGCGSALIFNEDMDPHF